MGGLSWREKGEQHMEDQTTEKTGAGKLSDGAAGMLVKAALEARKNAYCPYSGFAVGAALLCADGSVWCGCHIENAAITPGNCAERTAFFKAVSEGKHEFSAIAIVGGKADAEKLEFCPPCGVCRQVMREFCRNNFRIILAVSEKEYQVFTLGELLPLSFGPEQLGGDPDTCVK